MTALPLTVPELVIDVPGQPVSQGSKRIGRTKAGKPILLDDNDRALKTWRTTVSTCAGAAVRRDRWLLAEDVALAVTIDFYLPRPASVPNRARPHVKPDVDKLARACLDSLTSVVYRDDSRVVELVARKHYSRTGVVGARIVVKAIA